MRQNYAAFRLNEAVRPSLSPVISKRTGMGAAVVYRLIYDRGEDPYRFATGATYPGCKRTGTAEEVAACDGRSYNTLQAAIADAATRGEVPVKVTTLSEVDGILAGTIPVTSAMIYNQNGTTGGSSGGSIFSNLSPTAWAVIASVGLMLLTSRKR